MAINMTTIHTASNGAWQGDDPLKFAFPLLIIQTTLILLISRTLAFFLKPLRQPKVIAEILGGILLGPSLLGRNKSYMRTIFPPWSTPILETTASIGLLFFLFMVGLELDLTSIRRSGRRAAAIAAAGISLPFLSGIGISFVLRQTVSANVDAGYAPFLVFMGVALSITAFPVLARILAELKLLTTPLGETAMAAAAFNDVAAWVLLALAVALSGSQKSPLVSLWVLLSGLGFVIAMLLLVRPFMSWVAKRSQENETLDEFYICLTLAGVLVSGFLTDLIGIHSIFGAFVFGLMIPKEGEFAGMLIERIEDFVSGLLLPLYFASSGLKTNVATIHGIESWGLLGLVIFTACVGKVLGTFVVAILHKIPAREAITLGFLMNTKGLVELIVLNIGKERKVLNDETFAILVLMALFTTFITTPTVMAVYKPARRSSPYIHRKLQSQSPTGDELRLLACLHGSTNIPSLINLVETTRGTKKSPLKLYIMHLVELSERSSAIMMVQRGRNNGIPFWNKLQHRARPDRFEIAFEAYGQLSRVRVRPMTAISPLGSMHEDVCRVAEEKKVAMVILPFHRRFVDGEMETVGPGWRSINERILKEAGCSVAVLVDRGLGGWARVSTVSVEQRVCVVFFGGPDDREGLELGGRMAEHPGVRVKVIRFLPGKNWPVSVEKLPGSGAALQISQSEKSRRFSPVVVMDRDKEQELDGFAVGEFRQKSGSGADYEEREVARNCVESAVELAKHGGYGLMVVGRTQFPAAVTASTPADPAKRGAECPELGPIGDALAMPGLAISTSVLVVRQYGTNHALDAPISSGTTASLFSSPSCV